MALGESGPLRGMGRTLNISRKGLLFETHVPFRPNQLIILTVAVENDTVELNGRVRHVRRSTDKYLSGIEFLHMGEGVELVLDRYLESFRSSRI